MAVKRYDGSAWQTVAGLGAQGAAATSSSIATWVKTASGGETSLSGNDDNSQSLSYTVGQELVFINGTLLKRGSDYTATNGTSITGLTALAANDVATVWTVNAFSVTNAISNTLVDAKGDLIVATAADTPARLAVGSANQVLTVDSSTATGLKWATPAVDTNGLVFITSSTFSNQASVTIDNCFTSTYATYLVTLESMSAATGGDDLQLQMRYGSTTLTSSYFGSYVYQLTNSATFSGGGFGFRSASQITLSPDVGSANTNGGGMFYVNPVGTGNANRASLWGQYANNNTETGVNFGSTIDSAQNYTGFLLKSSSTNITGTIRVYGLAKS